MTDSTMTLRPLDPADADALAVWAEDDRFCQHAGWTLRSPMAVRDFWVRQIQTPPAGLIRLAATTEENDLLGYVDLHGDGPLERELGFLVGPSHRWGRGLGGRVAEAGLSHGFDELSLDSIWAEAIVANAASVRILRSLGMRETERGSAETFLRIESYYQKFRLNRQEWNTSKLKR